MPHPLNPEPPHTDFSRRQFTALLALGSLGSLGGLSACGGGGSDTSPPVPTAPLPDPGLRHVAGGLGGPGFLAGQGADDTRLPENTQAMATHPTTGEVWFVGSRWANGLPVRRVGRVAASGELSYFEPLDNTSLPVGSVDRGVFDSLNRYLCSGVIGAFSKRTQVYRMDTTPPTLLAGGGDANAPVQDGQGIAAVLGTFGSPVRGPANRVYFLDNNTVRSLSVDGVVTTLANLPAQGLGHLVNGPNGTVRLCMTGATAQPQDWFELTEPATGPWTWLPLSSNWPPNLEPVATSLVNADTYWAVDNRSAPPQSVIQLRHLNGTLVRTWPRPRSVSSASVDGRTGHLLVSYVDSLSVPGVIQSWIDRLDPTRDDIAASLGLRSQAAHVDGVAPQARFNFVSAVSAATDAASGQLYIHTPLGLRTLHPVSATASTLSTAQVPHTDRLVCQASGDLVMSDLSSNLYRMAKNQTPANWTKWVGVPTGNGISANVSALAQDHRGQLWFATRFDAVVRTYPPAKQTSVLGTVGVNGAIQILWGDPNLGHTFEDYPAPEQRPWYFDIVDLAFQGETVSWLLCNRSTYVQQSHTTRTDAVLVRLENGTPRSFTLTPPGTQLFHRLCTLPSRPGEVFLASAGAVYRWSEAAGLRLLAGQADGMPIGVRPGALPAHLNDVKFISPGPTAHSLYIGSENSVLRLDLPA